MTNKLPIVKTTEGTDNVLTEKQSNFVDNLLASGGNRTQSAIDAGYSKNSASVEASRLCKNNKVLAELHRRSVERIGIDAIKALHQVSSLSSDAKSEYVRLEASKDLLDRAGISKADDTSSVLAGNIQVNIDLG
jgi:phage terminase small subunit